MAGISNAAEALVLDGFNRVTAAYQPAALYLAIFTTNPDFELGTGGVEATGGSYARQAMTMGAAAGTAPTTASNTNVMTWTQGTNIAAGTYTGYGVYSASGSGTFLFGAAFGQNRILAVTGDNINFAAGSVIDTLD